MSMTKMTAASTAAEIVARLNRRSGSARNGPGPDGILASLLNRVSMVSMLAQSQRGVGGPSQVVPPVADGNSSRRGKKSARATILVVDDEALIRWSIAETLADHGFDVVEAGDAASAIRAVAANGAAVDAVLLDLRLPDSDDLRALCAIHRVSPRTPVILMTAFGTRELFEEARRAGAAAIIDKPFEMEMLAPLVERALASRPH
jgi:CheY-like chemotaxis protein